jgi:hypothetical protein
MKRMWERIGENLLRAVVPAAEAHATGPGSPGCSVYDAYETTVLCECNNYKTCYAVIDGITHGAVCP